MLPSSINKFISLSQIINIDNERGIIEYKSKDNNIRKLNIKEFSKSKDEKNRRSSLPIINPNPSMKNLIDNKILNTNQIPSFEKSGKKVKLKLKVNDNNNINNINNNNISNNNPIFVIQSKKNNLLKQNEKNDSLFIKTK